MKRVLVARSTNIATRQRVYRIADGFEIDEIDHYEVRRSRVLYEDVVLVTYHRYRGWLFFTILGTLALLCGIMSWSIAQTESLAGWIVAGVTTLPLVLVIVLRAIFGVDEVNVYGRRSSAKMRFVFGKRRARRLMEEIVADVRSRQTGGSMAEVKTGSPAALSQ